MQKKQNRFTNARHPVKQIPVDNSGKQLILFSYQNTEDFITNVRTIEIDGEVWFVAADVCRVLDLKDVSMTASRLDEDEKLIQKLFVSGQNRDILLINESGLYSLVLTSNKPEAKKFKRWITHNVIPSIRKTGEYNSGKRHTPIFVQRFHENSDRVTQGYFSVIGELFIRVYGKLEAVGHQIADHSPDGKEIRMDVSVGLLFPKWLELNYPNLVNCFTKYNHMLPNGFEVEARQYENKVLAQFIEFVETDWIINNARKYFKGKDDKALEYLPKLLPKKSNAA